jgi:4-hydroxybenzoate polyprenyltransferase
VSGDRGGSQAATSPRSPAGLLVETLRLVRFSHTLFALPFALTAMLLAAGGLPESRVIGWILVAMVGARTAAMTFNRIVDRRVDALNPRTAGRSLPAGRLSVGYAWVVFAVACALLVTAAWRLNPLALVLSPVALVTICGYSLTKRFTSWTHLVLGLSLAGAPLGAWIAVRGSLAATPLLLAAAVLFWTAGFDMIYACQDLAAARASGLRSIPARFGAAGALGISRGLHALAVVLLAATGLAARLGPIWFGGVAGAGALLLLEHRLVGPEDLSRLDAAFFRANVGVSLLMLACAAVETLLRPI